MVPELFADGRVHLHCGDCVEVLASLPECSVDAVCCDPPYHLTSIVKRFGADNAAAAQYGTDGVYARASAGFMGQRWDGGDVAFRASTWAAVFRVLRPGGHLLAMGGTRTFHRLACAIEDAGFEIRDMIAWLYGSGFPKSHDVSKAIDRMLGVEREKVRCDNSRNPKATGGGRDGMEGATRPWIEAAMERGYHELDSDSPATWAARQWDGFGSALKPAMEPCCLARKPLVGTIAENVLKHGTGALNIDGCRVEGGERDTLTGGMSKKAHDIYGKFNGPPAVPTTTAEGRWPANVVHDGSPEVLAAFPDARSAGDYPSDGRGTGNGVTYLPQKEQGKLYSDSGSAARFFASFNGRDGEASAERRYTDDGSTNFAALPGARRDGVPPSRLFYTSKADADDRLGSRHPTCKPLSLMQYLVRMITPPGGTVLDPFAGTGTTAEAALREGFRAILIEREAQYCEDIRRRMKLAFAGPDERTHASIKARGLVESPGPLFDGWPDAAE